MSSITDALIDSLTESEDFIDKLFANEYFCKKIKTLISNKTKLDKCPNPEDILWIDESECNFITTYQEFINLTDAEIRNLYNLNDFNLYKHFIKQACIDGKIKPVHLDTHKYGIVEIFVELIHTNQSINLASIGYTLIEKFYPTALNLNQICQISGVESIDEFYDKLPNNVHIPRLKKDIFMNANILVNYLKEIQVDSQYIKKLFDNELPYRSKQINYFSNVYEKYSYAKIPICEVLEWFYLSESDSVLFKKNTYGHTSRISLSYAEELKQTIKNFFEKVCTKPDESELDPNYIKYTKIINWLKN